MCMDTVFYERVCFFSRGAPFDCSLGLVYQQTGDACRDMPCWSAWFPLLN